MPTDYDKYFEANGSPCGKTTGYLKAKVLLLVIPACRESGCSVRKKIPDKPE